MARKILAVFTLALCVLCMQGYAQTHKTQQGTKADKPSPPVPPIAPKQVDSPQLQSEPTHNVNAEVRVVSTPSKDSYDKAVVWINFGLAIVGLCGIGIAIATLRKIERQIRVAEADTHAMIRGERAWIVARVKEIEPGIYVFSVKNEGKTPAKVLSVWCAELWLPRGQPLYIPPDTNSAESQIQNPPFLLPPGGKRSIWRLERTTVERMSGGGMGDQSRFIRGFGSHRTYGRIRYHDVLDAKPTDAHETRFLYILIPQPGTVPIPDPFATEHNSYT